jgi:hypothetical protein
MDPYTLVANALEAIITNTFGIVPVHDKIHVSLGFQAPVVGIAPLREDPTPSDRVVQETYVEIRYFDRWNKDINPYQTVDPRLITAKAEQLRAAINTYEFSGSGTVWFFHVEGTDYPDDPTGNKTRFVMTIKAWGNNAALVETTA